VHFLNREYARRNEIAELWLRGHDNLAQYRSAQDRH